MCAKMTVQSSRMRTLRKKRVLYAQSRWKLEEGRRSRKNVMHKVLHYFPLGHRLKCLFATSKTAKLMRWHRGGKSTDDNVMQYPVDGKAWKDFDISHPLFANDERIV